MKEAELTQEATLPSLYEFKDVYEAGQHQVIKTAVEDVPVFIIPQDMKIENLQPLVDQLAERPRHLQQVVELYSIESFIEYHNRFATDTSTVFVNQKEGLFTSVLDYHEAPNAPLHKRHKAVYKCPTTPEWSSWKKSDNEKMDQETFALFIEDNIREFLEPDGATMMEIATTLKAKNDVSFSSGIQLHDGQVQFSYQEKIDGNAGVNGQLSIPQKLKIVVKPFLNGAPYEMEAHFRYRVSQGKLTMWYKLIRPHAVHDDAVNDVRLKLSEGIEKGQVLMGTFGS